MKKQILIVSGISVCVILLLLHLFWYSNGQTKNKCFCSYCAKEDIAWGWGRDCQATPPLGQCPSSPNGKHRWLRGILVFHNLDGTEQGHSHSYHDKHKFLLPQILEKLNKFPKSERAWFLEVYNRIIDTEKSGTYSSYFFLQDVSEALWCKGKPLKDYPRVSLFLKQYKETQLLHK